MTLLVKLTPRCADITRLVSQSMDRDLPWWTRTRVRVHFSICVWCQRYAEHLRHVRNAAGCYADHLDDASDVTLSTEAKSRLKSKLKNVD